MENRNWNKDSRKTPPLHETNPQGWATRQLWRVSTLRCGRTVGFCLLCFLLSALLSLFKDLHMKPKKLNPGLLWMQFEDVLAPRLGLTVFDRAVYSHLLRHSLVVGKPRLQFAVIALARTLGLSFGAARQAVRRLDELGALRVLERSKRGHLAEMRAPEKIRAIRLHRNGGSM